MFSLEEREVVSELIEHCLPSEEEIKAIFERTYNISLK